ncbi:MAG: ABC transporter permease [Chloroflexota bacterium]|nr:ABC transporter permease [Chloroflexota bacterium]
MSYIRNNPEIVRDLLAQHAQIVLVALAVALAVALPLGILIDRYRWLAAPVMGALGLLYTVPSLALMILLIPYFGLDRQSVIAALIIYSQVILVRNIVAGLGSIDPAIVEAARGMGMNGWQVWWRVQFPLALPVILAGLRIAAVVAIGVATIGALFAAGGLGRLLFDGIAQDRPDKIAAGSLVIALLALTVNTTLLALERVFDPARRAARTGRVRRRWRVSRQTVENAQPLQG